MVVGGKGAGQEARGRNGDNWEEDGGGRKRGGGEVEMGRKNSELSNFHYSVIETPLYLLSRQMPSGCQDFLSCVSSILLCSTTFLSPFLSFL
jgi:hypothetical protein